MAEDRPEQPDWEPPAHDEPPKGFALIGQVAVGVLRIVALVVLSTRLRWLVLMLVIVPIGVVILLVSSGLWAGVLYLLGRVLNLPIGPNEGLPAPEGVGQVLVLLLGFGPPLIVTLLATRWVLRRLLLWVDQLTSRLEG